MQDPNTELERSVQYELSVDQLEAYDAGEPMFLAIPMPANIRLQNPADPEDLIEQACKIVPDLDPKHVDYVKPGFTFTNLCSPKPSQKTTLEDVFGRPVSNLQAKDIPFSVSIWCIMLSVHEGRANRRRPQFPGGPVIYQDELFFAVDEKPGEEIATQKRSKPLVDSDYFVSRNFGDKQ